MPKKGGNISLSSYDDIFQTDQSREEDQQERVQEIPLSELHPFKGHPFKVLDDEAMQKTVESIAQFGVMTPAIARPRPEGGYELIAGHRRHHASELAGKETMPVIVRDMDDDAATILMVDSNLQRETLLPSERAFAYKMKLEAIKHQGQRTDLTSSQVGMKLQAMDIVGQEAGDSRNQVHRYIRLTELIPELLDILQQITDWLKEMLISAIMGNLSGMFESVNNQVGEIATSVGRTPESFSPEIFAMVRNISESVIIPIAGLILTFIACYELIQLIIDHNNLANFETWIFFKWVFKTFVAVMLITNTFNITMAVFDVAQHVVNASGGIIAGNTAIDASGLEALEETLQGMDLGPLIGLLLQSFVVQITMSALAIIIFVIVYGRMIEIYLMVSLAPIPFSTFANREQNQIGQNYLRSLFALGFQGFLIIICVGIYAVLVQSLAFTDDIIADIWGIMGYTVLLCFTLFKTGTLAKSVFNTPHTINFPVNSFLKEIGTVRIFFNVSSVCSREIIYPAIRLIHIGKIMDILFLMTCSVR